jgi:hypothetical protein
MDLVLGIVDPLPTVGSGDRRFTRICTTDAVISGSRNLTDTEPPVDENLYAHVVGLEIVTGDGMHFNVHMEKRRGSLSDPRLHMTLTYYNAIRRSGYLSFQKPPEWELSDSPQVKLVHKRLPTMSDLALAFLDPGREGPRYTTFGCERIKSGEKFSVELRLTAIRSSGVSWNNYQFQAHDDSSQWFHGVVSNTESWLAPGKWR